MGDKDVNGSSSINELLSELLSMVSYDQWVLVNPSGVRPSGRYKHAAEVVQDKLYVIGGSRNGRYLADVQVFDIRSLEWSNVSANMDTKSDSFVSDQAFPASAGHSLVKWENKLVVVAGHSKEPSDTVSVWLLDLETHSWSAADTSGRVPELEPLTSFLNGMSPLIGILDLFLRINQSSPLMECSQDPSSIQLQMM